MIRRPSPVLSLVVLFAAACGGDPSPERSGDGAPGAGAAGDPVAQLLAAIEVSRVRTVGDLPPAETRFDVAVDRSGALYVDGEASPITGIVEALEKRAQGVPDRALLDVDAVLTLDRSLPWRVAQIVMQECANGRVRRVFFAVRHEGDGERGAIAAFLPEDVSVRRPLRDGPVRVAVQVAEGIEAGDPRGLETVLASVPEGRETLIEVAGAPTAPTELVLQLLDAAAVGGASDLLFIGTPYVLEGLDLAREVEAARERPVSRSLVTLGAAWPAGPAETGPVPRVEGAYAGFFDRPVADESAPEDAEPSEPDGR